MLDKLKGNKKNSKDTPPDLRKPDETESADVGGKIKDLVGKMSGKNGEKKGAAAPSGGPKKMPRPMPKPKIKPKPVNKPNAPKLKVKGDPKRPPKRSGGAAGLSTSGFGRRIPDDDQKTLIGAVVFAVILIVLIASLYYFLVYSPYQQTLQGAKDVKLGEVDAYFKGPLATDPQKTNLLNQINAGTTAEEVLAVDVLGPATKSWRAYQTQQIKTKKDPFGRVMVVYSTDASQSVTTTNQTVTPESQKDVIMKVADAQTFVNQADATVLANMEIKTPDTVAVPIMISRLQAAGGLISVGNMVDVYVKTAAEAAPAAANNSTNTTPATTTTSSDTPKISGATVLAILRAKDSGTIDASLLNSQTLTMNDISSTSSNQQTSTTDVEQLLRAAAAGGFNQAQTSALLQNYGIKLSDYERSSNLGDLDTTYLVLLEVPREDVSLLIQSSESLILTLPTQQAPNWMTKELISIYG
ncbi:MAG: DUF515 domain-containing protein [Methanobacteriaceae archaeon]|nr:DUF515 domain-containing protein [Methanobacteriaceae archaeon]MDP2837060.1 DUF515 domain-containing protein [Methanobacteriaceae archaeon]MDP3484502.1 DUF515 domain-containing protein [Methanobacteriaceae archaeon]MDP3624450.1 DUF515 domain-containing protein [Methanobacteriaceae archaeon]